jgi:transcriptional regulator with XRE-family HTH domain
MATDSLIGTKIRKRREALGLTQKQLAERLNVHWSSVLNWEKGRHLPARHVGAIESVLGVSLDGGELPPPISEENQALLRKDLGEKRFAEVMAFLAQRADDDRARAQARAESEAAG